MSPTNIYMLNKWI